ncbi:hypothetical protein [Peribacillus sp. SI8-4]|uniref:hypothetical protein n=1 Tax=Peribacillus sp. SI8-4 TaxID=3048009 RepID=UPI002552B5FD|nr:hypothetical protein [Peribacillus sp. SI8-4]
MSTFIVNKAGAKIFNDVSKHEELPMPALNSTAEDGVIYKVLSVGMNGRTPIASIKVGSEVVAYKLPSDLYGWAENFLMMAGDGLRMLPAKIEFGILDGRAYAEII